MTDYPGYLGWTSQGVVAIHADWPAYPREHGWAVALLTLGDFPLGTTFRCLDNIDRCSMFVVEDEATRLHDMHEDRFHVAIWHEDLQDLVARQYVAGIEIATVSAAREIYLRQSLGPKLYELWKSGAQLGTMINGNLIPFDPPEPYDFDDEDDLPTTARLAVFEGSTIVITADGEDELYRIAKMNLRVPASMQRRVLPLLADRLFDTAVRELGVALEERMKSYAVSTKWGMALVGAYMARLDADEQLILAHRKALRQELRAAMRFVRNEFAHNLVELPSARGYALVGRLAATVATLEEIAALTTGRDWSDPGDNEF